MELAEAYADGAVAANDLQAMNDPTQFSNLEDRLYEQRLNRDSRCSHMTRSLRRNGWRSRCSTWRMLERLENIRPSPRRRLLSDARDEDAARERGDRRRGAAKVGRIMRDVFGNPFHPILLSSTHRTPTVVALALAGYDERQLPSGELELDRLSILADGLEDAGCVDEDILDHLRSPGPHFRGCWAVDLCLGLS